MARPNCEATISGQIASFLEAGDSRAGITAPRSRSASLPRFPLPGTPADLELTWLLLKNVRPVRPVTPRAAGAVETSLNFIWRIADASPWTMFS